MYARMNNSESTQFKFYLHSRKKKQFSSSINDVPVASASVVVVIAVNLLLLIHCPISSESREGFTQLMIKSISEILKCDIFFSFSNTQNTQNNFRIVNYLSLFSISLSYHSIFAVVCARFSHTPSLMSCFSSKILDFNLKNRIQQIETIQSHSSNKHNKSFSSTL